MLADGYFIVHESLWERIPKHAHVRYFVKSTPTIPADAPRRERFRTGGFVKAHFVTPEGKKMFVLENSIGGKKVTPGYVSFTVAFDNFAELWKKYETAAFVEMHLIMASLAQKKQQVADLKAQVSALEDRIKALERGRRGV